ncbi:MAG: GTPase Era, partial [Alphaproteobacteria bacterium]|nr:GTPase Era [Alphaproteobacteria bacterium]
LTIRDNAQIVFVDTPGIFQPKRRLDRAMVAAAWAGAADADIVVLLVDAQKGVTQDARRIVEGLEKAGRKAILALNKIDLVRRDKLLELADTLNESGVFTDIFMISATTGDGVEDLAKTFVERLPEGPWLYPEDQLSDMAERHLAAEVTREKLFLKLHQELPYALTVETEEWQDKPDGSVRIAQIIYVQRDTQKSIVLGKGGQMIKSVGAAARADLEEMMGCRVHLFLFVKVREKWGDDPDRYRDWGLDFNA